MAPDRVAGFHGVPFDISEHILVVTLEFSNTSKSMAAGRRKRRVSQLAIGSETDGDVLRGKGSIFIQTNRMRKETKKGGGFAYLDGGAEEVGEGKAEALEELLVRFHRGLAVEDGEVVDREREAVGVPAARAVGEEEVGVGSGGAGDRLWEREAGTALGVKVEGDPEAETDVAGHGGEGEVGGPITGGSDAPENREVDAVDAEESEGAEAGCDGFAVVHGVAVGDRIQRQTDVQPNRTRLNQN